MRIGANERAQRIHDNYRIADLPGALYKGGSRLV